MQQDFDSNEKWQILNVTAKKLWLGQKKKKKTLYTTFHLLHKRVGPSIFFFFENFGFAVCWRVMSDDTIIIIIKNYQQLYIGFCREDAKRCYLLLRYQENCHSPRHSHIASLKGATGQVHTLPAYFPRLISPWCAQVDEAIEINVGFRLACRLPLRRLIISSCFSVSALRSHAALALSPSGIALELITNTVSLSCDFYPFSFPMYEKHMLQNSHIIYGFSLVWVLVCLIAQNRWETLLHWQYISVDLLSSETQIAVGVYLIFCCVLIVIRFEKIISIPKNILP